MFWSEYIEEDAYGYGTSRCQLGPMGPPVLSRQQNVQQYLASENVTGAPHVLKASSKHGKQRSFSGILQNETHVENFQHPTEVRTLIVYIVLTVVKDSLAGNLMFSFCRLISHRIILNQCLCARSDFALIH